MASEKDVWAIQPLRNEVAIAGTAEQVAKKERRRLGINRSRYGMRLSLKGIYIKEAVFYFQLGVENRSLIPYQNAMLRFFIRDQKTHRRTASQEIELAPLNVHGSRDLIEGSSENTLVVAVPTFSIREGKYLFIQLMDGGGGRALQLKIPYRTILKAHSVD